MAPRNHPTVSNGEQGVSRTRHARDQTEGAIQKSRTFSHAIKEHRAALYFPPFPIGKVIYLIFSSSVLLTVAFVIAEHADS